jgi:23S rRNA (cytidine1920-2'-O)/16S rRNA (cytidine1409-2'-O)-methyltransferase
MPEVRLDNAIVLRGLVESRTKAKRRLAAGDVVVNGVVTSKPSMLVKESDTIEVQGGVDPVGRGALKLAPALDQWGIDPHSRTCLDLGASTGGFTEVLLGLGAQQVVALDVGRDQLHPRIAKDPRVLQRDGVNAKELTVAVWAEIGVDNVSLVVADLSFISLTQIISPVVSAVGLCDWVCLIKPQFEVGRERISEGIAKQADSHDKAILAVLAHARESGLHSAGIMRSPITGEAGNTEYLCWLSPTERGNQTQWSLDIHTLTHS